MARLLIVGKAGTDGEGLDASTVIEKLGSPPLLANPRTGRGMSTDHAVLRAGTAEELRAILGVKPVLVLLVVTEEVHTSIAELLRSLAAERPEESPLVVRELRISTREVNEAVGRVINWLFDFAEEL